MMKSLPLVLLVFIGCASTGGAGSEDPHGLIEQITPAQIVSWHPNGPMLLHTWSQEEADTARKAIEKLRDMGLRAFPALVAHIDDPRPSVAFWQFTGAVTVGDVCFHILSDAVNPPTEGKAFVGEIPEFVHRSSITRTWWAERAGKSLAELHLESTMFALAMLRDKPSARGRYYVMGYARGIGLSVVDPAFQEFARRRMAITIPDDADSLVQCFRVSGKTYLDLRFSQERADRAWGKLYDKGVGALPALIQAVADPTIGNTCFELAQQRIEDLPADDYLYARVIFLSPDNIAAWWNERKTLTLRELKVEATREHLRRARTAPFKVEVDRKNLIEFLTERLEKLQHK